MKRDFNSWHNTLRFLPFWRNAENNMHICQDENYFQSPYFLLWKTRGFIWYKWKGYILGMFCLSWFMQLANIGEFELEHDKINKMTCAPSEDADQPVIRPVWLVFTSTVRLKKVWFLSYPYIAQRRLRSDWAHRSFCLFFRTPANMLTISVRTLEGSRRDLNSIHLYG